jgi:hypothetical protein
MDSQRGGTRGRPAYRRSAHSARREASDGVTLRRMLLGAIVLVLAQAAVGMAVNLYVTVHARHPGAHPSNYLSGSFDSVT